MGLLYVFPVSLEEKDFAKIKDQTITVKTYGLPYIFWAYAAAIIMVILFMFLAIKAPILKLVAVGDDVDSLLGYGLLVFIGLLPIFILSVFFYEKRIVRDKNSIALEYRVFGIKLFSQKYVPAEKDPFVIAPYLASPNRARIDGGDDAAGFQNKGYFTLKLNTASGKTVLIDRHSRKIDLIKLAELLKLIS
jgi:hypothetical protein